MLGAGPALHLEQVYDALTPGETFHGEFQPAGGGHLRGEYAAAEVAIVVPNVQAEARAADFERVASRRKRENIIAGFEQVGSEEVFYKSA